MSDQEQWYYIRKKNISKDLKRRINAFAQKKRSQHKPSCERVEGRIAGDIEQNKRTEKEHNNWLVEEQESLKLVVKLLSKDLYYKLNDSTSLPKENGNGNIMVVDDTISTPIVPPAESLTSVQTRVIPGDSSKICRATS